MKYIYSKTHCYRLIYLLMKFILFSFLLEKIIIALFSTIQQLKIQFLLKQDFFFYISLLKMYYFLLKKKNL